MQITTPTGTAMWPKLDKPDTKFNAAGEYKVKITWRPDDDGYNEAERIIADLDTFCETCCSQYDEEQLEEFNKKQKKNPKKGAKPPEPGKRQDKGWGRDSDDDGDFIYINFKMRASYEKDGETKYMRPSVFNAKNVLLKNVPAIGNGSLMKVAGKADFYATPQGIGLTMRLEGVKLIKIESYNGRDASSFGFGGEEEGYDGDGSEGSESKENEEKSAKGRREVDLDDSNSETDGDGEADGDDGYKDS